MKDGPFFGVSTWLWTSPFTMDSMGLFAKISSMGFTHVEIPVEDPDLIQAKEVHIALKDHGLLPVVCGAFGPTRDLTHEDPKVHQQCFDYLQRCFDFCSAWGATFVAGPLYSAVGKTRMLPPDERQREWDLAVKNIQIACEMAKSHQLSLAIEPLNRFESDLVNTAADVKRLIRDIDRPNAKILLDGFHMSIEEKSMEEAISIAGSDLIHLQVSENYRGTPGTGQTDWAGIKRGLDAINYHGVISIESFTPNVQELAGAVCIWKKLAPSQDQFASEGLSFLQNLFSKSSA